MEEDDHPSSTQLIDGDGVFNVSGMEDFLTMTGFTEVGLSYAVVSVVGPQSSGKSTLLNHLFRTNFTEMDAFKGRNQTTKGIWIEKSVDIKPYTIVLDLEGTDGRERGEDDTSFEKKSALFALAVSDVVLINMWCHDIGREQAANKPLLKTVFQVMMRLFSPRRTTLLFVIRDKTKTPLESLEPVLREDIQKIWDNVPKPQTHKDTPISDFFNVEIVALSNYETKEEEFNEQVLQLRQRFFNSIAPGNLAGDRRGVIPASGFSFSAQQIWTIIKENKELDLPAHKVMVATVRCEEIGSEKLSQLASDEGWLMLQAAVKFGPLVGFGKKLGTIIDTYLSEYDMEAVYFDEGVRTVKRKEMESKALDLAHPAYHAMMIHLRSKVLDSFKKRFEESLMRGEQFFAAVRDCTDSSLNDFDLGYQDVVVKNAMWTSLKAREKLLRDIETHTASVCTTKLSELVAEYENKLEEALEHPVVSLLDVAEKDCWASIRRVFKKEVEKATSGFLAALMGFRLDNEPCNQLVEGLKNFARSTVERKARDEAAEVLIRMKDRFLTEFSHDHDSLPRVWTGKEDIRKITKDASAAALNLLAVLAVIRMEERPDKIAAILSSLLSDGVVAKERSNDVSSDPFTSKTWEEVPPEDVLITPVQCQQVWKRFNMDIEYIVSQAQSAQEAHRRNSSWMPPWAFLAIGILGFNEFMLLLKNPFYLMAVLVMFLVFKAIWVQLDVPGELENGIFPGLLRLCYRIIPTTVTVLRRVAQKDKKQLSNVAMRPQQTPEESQHENTEIHHSPQRLHVPMRRNVQSFMFRTQRIPTRTNSMPADKYSRLSSMISISERELEQIVSQSRLECTEEEQPTSDSLEERM